MQEITTLISNVGFPIFACVMMFQQQKELNKAIAELSLTLKIFINDYEEKRVA